jgi:hypothetical protein
MLLFLFVTPKWAVNSEGSPNGREVGGLLRVTAELVTHRQDR